jgi:hypothetical protein
VRRFLWKPIKGPSKAFAISGLISLWAVIVWLALRYGDDLADMLIWGPTVGYVAAVLWWVLDG